MPTSPSRSVLRLVVMSLGLALLALAPACGNDVGVGGKVVGGHCRVPSDCEGTCLVDSHFPEGLCTRACANDTQCPGGTACVKEDGSGFCAVLCTTVPTCTDFGPQYVCSKRDRFGASGDVMICRVP